MSKTLSILCAAALVACGGSQSASTTPSAEPMTQAEVVPVEQAPAAEPQTPSNALTGIIDPARVEHGQARFERVCGLCHEDGDAPQLRGMRLSEQQLRTIVREGHGHMRPISTSRLNDADLDDVVAYLKTIETIVAPAAAN